MLLGISILVSAVQPPNARPPMFVTIYHDFIVSLHTFRLLLTLSSLTSPTISDVMYSIIALSILMMYLQYYKKIPLTYLVGGISFYYLLLPSSVISRLLIS